MLFNHLRRSPLLYASLKGKITSLKCNTYPQKQFSKHFSTNKKFFQQDFKQIQTEVLENVREENLQLKTVVEESTKQPVYGFPEFLTKSVTTKITTLENGFRVVSEPRISSTAAVGVFIKAGSRAETKSNNGVAHFLEHMYFKGTEKRTSKSLEVEYENAGAQMNAHTSREYTCFTSHCLANDIERSVDSLADVLLNSKLSRHDIEAERSTILREADEVATNIDEVLFDEMHLTAFPTSSLGFTILGPKENIQSLTREQMVEFRDTFYTAPNMILVGVGNVDHEQLVHLGQKYFGKVPSEPVSGFSNEIEPARYVGAETRIWDTNMKNLYSAIAFKGPSLHSADMLAVNLIQILLGNWDQAMGVGRHISSPFCANIAELNLARSVTVFNHAYSDVGVFGVQLVQDEHQCEDTPTLHFFTTQSMTRLCYRVNNHELERAKNIFKNQILSQYEGRLDQVLEEVGKQMLFYGRRPSAAEMFARIDAITEKDINRVATKYIYDQDPVIVNIGKTDNCPDWNHIKVFTYSWKT